VKPRPLNLTEVDVDLELAIQDLRGYCSRLPHGRVILAVTRHERVTIAHDLAVDPLTADEIERLMREKPRRKR
jgi:GAF domain-containing protein